MLPLNTIFGFKTLKEARVECLRWAMTENIWEDDFLNCELFKEAYKMIFGDRSFPEAAQYLEAIENQRSDDV